MIWCAGPESPVNTSSLHRWWYASQAIDSRMTNRLDIRTQIKRCCTYSSCSWVRVLLLRALYWLRTLQGQFVCIEDVITKQICTAMKPGTHTMCVPLKSVRGSYLQTIARIVWSSNDAIPRHALVNTLKIFTCWERYEADACGSCVLYKSMVLNKGWLVALWNTFRYGRAKACERKLV